MEQLERLLAAEPDDAFLNFALAMELAKIERLEDAVARFERAIELDAGYCAAYYQKAKTLLQANVRGITTPLRSYERCCRLWASGR